MDKKVTIMDIARAVGVTHSTVSHAISGKRPISDDVKRRIFKVMEELQYRPNLNARALTGRSPQTIGVLIDTMASHPALGILSHLERLLAQEGYRIMTAEAHDDLGRLYDSYRTLQQYGVDGVIVLAHDYPGYAADAERCFGRDPRLIFIGEPAFAGVNCVAVRYESGIAAAVRHLLDQGRRRLGILLEGDQYRSVHRQLEGFVRCAPDPANHRFIEETGDDLPEALDRAVEQFVLPQRLDGLIVTTDLRALGVISALTRRGLSVPEDIALIGNNDEPLCRFTQPQLSSICENSDAVAAEAVKLMMELIRDGGIAPRRIFLDSQLVIRDSSSSKTINH